MPAPEPPVCSYEGSDYQTSFWDQGGRQYEDRAEAAALKRLLPQRGRLLLELGAGAGRNTPRYAGFEKVVLLDFSVSQLRQAQARLGRAERHVFVAADAYRLPFIGGLFDCATMIRVLHHMADAPAVLAQVRDVLERDATFILEFANKRNLKSILRYLFGRQTWSPFSPEPIEFARLNFDFHPRRVQDWLEELGFRVERKLSVSHFRLQLLKRTLPTGFLVLLESMLQPTGQLWQYTPSVFFRARGGKEVSPKLPGTGGVAAMFKCPACGHSPLVEEPALLSCRGCGQHWPLSDGIYDFRMPAPDSPEDRRIESG